MSELVFLQSLKVGDFVIRELHGAGVITESIEKIEYINDTGIFIEGADGDYSKDSCYRFFPLNGKSVNNFVPSFYSKIVKLATEEDFKRLE